MNGRLPPARLARPGRPRGGLPLALLLAAGLAAGGGGGCATAPPAPGPTPAPAPTPGPAPGPGAARSAAEPPRFQPPAAPPGGATRPAIAARAEDRRRIFDGAWRLVKDRHYDPTLGGLDWNAVRSRYEAKAVGAPDEATFYRVCNEMIGELGQSHMMLSGPGADDGEAKDDGPEANQAALAAGPQGDPGLLARVIEGRLTVTGVRSGSPAERAGIRPGFILTHVGGREMKAAPAAKKALRPVEERFFVRLAAQRRLTGPAGSKVVVKVLDLADRPAEILLEREAPHVPPVQIGYLPPLYPEVRVSQQAEVAVVAFNIFLLQPVLDDLKRAIDGLPARGARALVLDLRGNPGGQGAMAIPVAARLLDEPLTLGTIHYRGFANVLTARPERGARPFLGPVVILTDEGSASTSEILAGGLQEGGRATVVGDTTLGAVLPSVIEALPGGAVMQMVVADFKTPRGVLLEGRGVQPDRRIVETRAAFRDGRDPVLEAGVDLARALVARQRKGGGKGRRPAPQGDAAGPAAAPLETTPTVPLPAARTPEAIVADFVAATGGRKAWTAHRSMHVEGRVSLKGMGLSGTSDRIVTAADRASETVVFSTIMTTRQGTDGRVAWSSDPINGTRILEGIEAEQTRLAAAWNAELRLGALYLSVAAVGEAQDGVTYECLVLTPRIGYPTTNCYEPQGHLLAYSHGVSDTPQGPVPGRTVVGDWRTLPGGLRMPFRSTTRIGTAIEIESQTTAVTFDQTFPDAVFAPPAPKSGP